MARMSAEAIESFQKTQEKYNRWTGLAFPDVTLMVCIILLMLTGLVMVATASIPRAGSMGDPFFFLNRQAIYMGVGLLIAYIVFLVPTRFWHENSRMVLIGAFVFLILVIIPGIGREINGAMRWIPLGPVNIQVSEFVRVAMMIFAAAYLQKNQNQINKSLWSMIKLLIVLGLVSVLLLLEPDFGSTAVIGATVLGMAFLAGVCIVRFSVLSVAVAVAATGVLIAAPYRRARLSSFMDPWDDPFGKSYQLVQSLIAIGRGETFGVGLGESIQKHHYLPEAHTDFIFSILAEEMGLVGVVCLMLIYVFMVWRAFVIANQADKVRMRFASCLAYGIGLWVGMQTLINMSVASGILPTKGLTLPMISYGGSSVLASLIAFAILLRIDSESKYLLRHEHLNKRHIGLKK